MEYKISLEVAQKEWENFLEENDATSLLPDESLKDSSEKEERESYLSAKTNLEKIVKAIARGFVTIENGIVTQKLQSPILSSDKQSVLFDVLKFSERWTAKDRQEIFKGLDPSKANEAMAIQQKLCAKLTGVDNIVLGRIDIRDQKITDQIVSVFFM